MGKWEVWTEYEDTKGETDELVKIYTEWLSETKRIDCTYEPLPRFAPVDYRIFRNGKIWFFLEVKFRKHNKGYYEQEKVPFTKFAFAYTIMDLKQIPSFLLVRWKDRIGVVSLEDMDEMTEMIARHDLSEEKDMYALYRHTDFRVLEEVQERMRS